MNELIPILEQDTFKAMCPECEGSGLVPSGDGDGNETIEEACPECKGTGRTDLMTTINWDMSPSGTQHREARSYTMSLEQRRIKFAELLGWKYSPVKGNPNYWRHADGRRARSIKDLPMVTLQVVHDLESRLSQDQAHNYMRHLIQILKRDRKETDWDRHLYCFAIAHASLAHREEAILKTLGVWIPF